MARRMSGLKQQSSTAAEHQSSQAAKQESRKAAEHQSSKAAEQQSSRAAEQQSSKAPTNNTNTNPPDQPQTIKTTAANHENTCEEPNRYQKTSKKANGNRKKKDFPKKPKKLQKSI